jgi:hypothetical protein
MTHSQAGWAMTHDWFVDAFEHKGVVTVEVVHYDFSEINGHVRNDITFTDFIALKQWAGY